MFRDSACVCVLVTQSCPTLCDPKDCSSPGSSVHGILQARILEWVAILSRGSSLPRDQTHISCIGSRFFTTEPPGKPKGSTHNTCYNFFLGFYLYCVDTLWLTGLLQNELETRFSLESKVFYDTIKHTHFKKSPKRLSTMRETWVWFLGWEDPLEKEMAIHSRTIAWKIPCTEEPGWLQSMGSQRVGHDWATSLRLMIISQLRFTEENIALNIFYICLKETGILLFSYTAN